MQSVKEPASRDSGSSKGKGGGGGGRGKIGPQLPNHWLNPPKKATLHEKVGTSLRRP